MQEEDATEDATEDAMQKMQKMQKMQQSEAVESQLDLVYSINMGYNKYVDNIKNIYKKILCTSLSHIGN